MKNLVSDWSDIPVGLAISVLDLRKERRGRLGNLAKIPSPGTEGAVIGKLATEQRGGDQGLRVDWTAADDARSKEGRTCSNTSDSARGIP